MNVTVNVEDPVHEALLAAESLLRAGRGAEALVELRRAADAAPDDGRVLAKLGAELLRSGAHADARAVLARCAALAPQADALNDLGLACLVIGRFDEAAAAFRAALAFVPDSPEYWTNLGDSYALQKRAEPGLAAYGEALSRRPDSVRALNNRGNLRRELGLVVDAASDFRAALASDPKFVPAWLGLAGASGELLEFEAAVDAAREAVRLASRNPVACSLLGIALRNAGRVDEALHWCERAVELAPSSARALYNRAWLLDDLGRHEEALAGYERALAADATHAEAAIARAHALLRDGDYRRGWPAYAGRTRARRWRIETPDGLPRHAGGPLPARLALVAEQALGDTIQFARFGRALAARGCRAALVCHPRLVRLLGTVPGFEHVLAFGDTRAREVADSWSPLLTLPELLGLDRVSDLDGTPYVSAESALVARWRELLHAATPGAHVRVGIAWQGNANVERASLLGRSWPVAVLAPLADLPGVRLVSLQRGPGAEHLAQSALAGRVVDFGARLDGGPDAFVDSAALLSSLDVLVTSDSSLAHLAGALGRAAWVGLHHRADWRWGRRESATDWYPTLRLFRQRARGDWSAPVAEIATALRELTTRKQVDGCSPAPMRFEPGSS